MRITIIHLLVATLTLAVLVLSNSSEKEQHHSAWDRKASQHSYHLSSTTIKATADLWDKVEEKKPVESASVRKVVNAPAHVDVGTDPMERRYQTNILTTSRIDHLKFPKNFIYGTASAAPQVEGAVKADGRGPSIWDSFAHLVPDGMMNNDTFDVATNFRYLYPLDLARVKAMGLKSYSFSISWSRVLPLGKGDVSPKGLQFYEDLVDEIHGQGMEAVATLFHWDVPLNLEQEYAGFTNEKIVDDYVNYARVMFERLGAKGVKRWITFNEPQVHCNQRYPLAMAHVHGWDTAPKNTSYLCSSYLLKAHGKTFEVFDQMRKNGTLDVHSKISYKNSGSVNVPYNRSNKDDKASVQRGIDFGLGLFSEPVHGGGNYPKTVLDEVPEEWLPRLDKDDQKRLKGSFDFFSTDFYATSASMATKKEGGYKACVGNLTHPAWPGCTDSTYVLADGWPLGERSDKTTESWLSNTAGTLRRHLKYIYDTWNVGQGIYITEIGWAEKNEEDKTELWDVRNDDGRQRYFRDHLGEMLLSIYKDGTPLRGVYLWSATSNCEWEVGYASRFGLQSVNYTDPELNRTYLGSFYLVRDFFKAHT